MKFIFSDIPKYCINLKRNAQRRLESEIEFKKHNLQVEFFEAIDKNDLILPELSVKKHESNALGILGCALSHIALIRLAKEKKLPAICIFEDDVIFCDDFKKRIKYIESLQDFDFDIFSLGGHFSQLLESDEATNSKWPRIKKVTKHGGTYGLIFTEKTYDFILRNWNYNMGSDQFYSDHVYKEFNSYAFVPFLVGVKPNVSDVVGVYYKCHNVDWYYHQCAISNI